MLSSLVIKGVDDLNLQGGLRVTNRRVCIAKPLSGISKSQTGVFMFCKGQRKKESVDSELVRGRVSKFYWWVAIRSRAWGLVSLIV